MIGPGQPAIETPVLYRSRWSSRPPVIRFRAACTLWLCSLRKMAEVGSAPTDHFPQPEYKRVENRAHTLQRST